MAPSLQSQEPGSFTVGSTGSVQSGSGETQASSLLFKLASMKPPKRSLRTAMPGDGFGVGRLKTEETDSGSMYFISRLTRQTNPFSTKEKFNSVTRFERVLCLYQSC